MRPEDITQNDGPKNKLTLVDSGFVRGVSQSVRSDMAASEESELSCREQCSGLCVEAVVVTFASGAGDATCHHKSSLTPTEER